MNTRLFFFVVCLLINIGETVGQGNSVTVYTDEDLNPILLFNDASDQNYTMGFGFGFASPWLNSSLSLRPLQLLNQKILGHKFITNEHTHHYSSSLSLNGTGFTPDDLRATTPVIGDRPYAFLLALSTKTAYLKSDQNLLVFSELNVGALGLQIGKHVQTWIHEGMNDGDTKPPYTPRGWNLQVANGFSPAFLYSLGFEKLLFPKRTAPLNRSHFDIKYGGQAMAGYYTGIQGSIALRAGLLDSRNWTRSFNPLGNMNKGGAVANTVNTPTNERARFEVYAFASVRPTIMIYNSMLHGSLWRKSAYTLNFEETQPFFLEWSAGINTLIPLNPKDKYRSIDLSWVVNAGRTSELRTSYGRPHLWGAILLGYNF